MEDTGALLDDTRGIEPIYLYIHVPFCHQRCPYCNLTTGISSKHLLDHRNLSDAYLSALITEIRSFRGDMHCCLGLSFGGGTPSLMSCEWLETILGELFSCLHSFNTDADISLEYFPETKTRSELSTLRKMGFNRISLGAQSFSDKELRFLRRGYDRTTFLRSFEDARAAGFENINIDLMFGLPNQDMKTWETSVHHAIELQPEHLTTYHYCIYNGTEFGRAYRQGKLKMPGTELRVQQYLRAIELAEASGLSPYWDFSFAREPELEYSIEKDIFRFFPIRGFGADAWSQEGVMQQRNPPNVRTYIQYPNAKQEHAYSVDEYIMCMLMFPQGLVYAEFEALYGVPWATGLMGEKLSRRFSTWLDDDILGIDEYGFRFHGTTRARGAVEMADYQTAFFNEGEPQPFNDRRGNDIYSYDSPYTAHYRQQWQRSDPESFWIWQSTLSS